MGRNYTCVNLLNYTYRDGKVCCLYVNSRAYTLRDISMDCICKLISSNDISEN